MHRETLNFNIKNISIVFMVLLIAASVIALLVGFMFSYFGKFDTPTAFIIMSVNDNRKLILEDCDDSKITVLTNVVSDKIVYKCGELGKANEIITIQIEKE